MADSLSLITAQISFLHTELALVHIPIDQYSFFLHPILRLLFGDDHDEYAASIPWTNRHEFMNISITPNEVSIICPRELAQRYIAPIESALRNSRYVNSSLISLEIGREDYVVVQVDGQGLDASQRVLELTGPLAMAGISIFFITTYFSDYILVPSRSKRTVTTALEQRGFVFSQAVDAFVSQLSPALLHSPEKPDYLSASHEARPSSLVRSGGASAPCTPPAKDIDELQSRTFRKLRRLEIKPQADASLRLVSCAGSREPDPEMETNLKDDLLQVLLSTDPSSQPPTYVRHEKSPTGEQPNASAAFLSITVTSTEPVSILMEERLLPRLGNSLFGAKEASDVLVPIIFDLRRLGLETTGIIGGVASRLASGSKELGAVEPDDISPTSETVPLSSIEISYLSTAKSGIVIVKATQLKKAMEELEAGYCDENGSQ